MNNRAPRKRRSAPTGKSGTRGILRQKNDCHIERTIATLEIKLREIVLRGLPTGAEDALILSAEYRRGGLL